MRQPSTDDVERRQPRTAAWVRTDAAAAENGCLGLGIVFLSYFFLFGRVGASSAGAPPFFLRAAESGCRGDWGEMSYRMLQRGCNFAKKSET